MFVDRTDAGKKLAKALEGYRGQDVLVLAIPRGGVEVGFQVARHLGADLTIVVSRKLPYPFNQEAGFGAIAEDGSWFVFAEAKQVLSPRTIQEILQKQKREVERRVRVLRGDKPLPKIEGRTVILVDDGMAMGATMRATIELCKHQAAGKIVVAVPVSSIQVAQEVAGLVDDLVVLEMPPLFRAVAQVYENWHDVQDEEVHKILAKWLEEQDGYGD
jgi:putative phosphoribosyl transferase